MKKNTFLIIFLSLMFFQCKTNGNKNEEFIKIEMPFKSLGEIPYNNKSEPYLVCLREEYAFRFGDFNMHLQHSNIVELYSNAFNVPQEKLMALSEDSLNLEIGKWYLSKNKVPDSLYSKIYKAELVQQISDSISYVVCNDMVRYTLKPFNDKWKIVNKTGLDNK